MELHKICFSEVKPADCFQEKKKKIFFNFVRKLILKGNRNYTHLNCECRLFKINTEGFSFH